jgi:NAD(P)H dehydrogenase (quinone)
MKKILLIQGHPDAESFNFALYEAYKKGAIASRAELKEIIVRDLQFNPNLQFGYRKRTELEHIVLFYPVWWGSVPALLKGFIDRVFLPGIVFEKIENSVWWKKLLTGRTGHIVSTLDQPAWYYWLINGRPSYHAMKQMTFKFVGIKPVRTTTIGPIRLSKDAYRTDWLRKLEKLGFEQK